MVRTPQKRADEIFKIDRLLFISVRGVYCANKNRQKILIVLDASFKKMIPCVQKVAKSRNHDRNTWHTERSQMGGSSLASITPSLLTHDTLQGVEFP